MIIKVNIPGFVEDIIKKIKMARFRAYLVGGCVRDILIKKSDEPKDWDITTDAKPEEIQSIFFESVYENKFGTVGVKIKDKKKGETKIIEITTFRKEFGYSDKRHPDKIEFAKNIEDDLARRDFTINAMALEFNKEKEYKLIDLYDGQKDLKEKLIRAVGNPKDRFREDALRMMRAVRFFSQLNFDIEKNTEKAINDNVLLLKKIAMERIRDEFVKIIMSNNPGIGIIKLYELEILRIFVPELVETVDVGQNLHHIYTVWEHLIRSLDYCAKNNYSLEVRLASLFHDIGKPKVKVGEGKNSTFYNHEVVGAKMTQKILKRMKFPSKIIKDVTHLVRQHQFNYNVGEVTEAGVRRFIKRVGLEYVDDLLRVREADRIGSGVPKAFPYKLRHLLFMIEKVRRDPISHKMLKINGDTIMKITGIKPSPRVGMILGALMEEVLDDPSKNINKYLENRVKELNKLSEKELDSIAKKGKQKQVEKEEEEERKIKSKFWVK